MKYSLVMTKNGMKPIKDIKKDELVFCYGDWAKAPKPIKAEVKTLISTSLPKTSFEKRFVKSDILNVCHKMILNKHEKDELVLSAHGYFSENRKNSMLHLSLNRLDDLYYWYPRLIQYYGKVVAPSVAKSSLYLHGVKTPEPKELSGNELSERNLEYYLEGFMRCNFHSHKNRFFMNPNLSETAKLVLRLLDITFTIHTDYKRKNKLIRIENPLVLLKHIKDDYNKAKVSDEMIAFVLRHYDEQSSLYTPDYVADSWEDGVDFVLPGICPDINGISII